MVTVTPDAEKFINDLLEKNKKVGYGIKCYYADSRCDHHYCRDRHNADQGLETGTGFTLEPSDHDVRSIVLREAFS